MPKMGKVERQTERVLSDPRLSFRAKGLWCHLAKTRAKRVSADELAASATEGRDAIRTAINELVNRNYLFRDRTQDPETGQWSTETRPIYPATDSQGSGRRVVTMNPKAGSQASGKKRKKPPTTGYPTSDSQALICTNTSTSSEEYVSTSKKKRIVKKPKTGSQSSGTSEKPASKISKEQRAIELAEYQNQRRSTEPGRR